MSQQKEVDKFLTTMKKSFNYLTKLKQVKQKRKSITFFKNFITDQITRTRERESILIHRKQLDDEYIDSFEDLLIQELEKPLIKENQLNDIISFNSQYRTHFNNLKERNIDMMIFLLKHFNRCRKYIRMNSFTDELLRILVSLSTTEHFCKGTPIYRMNTKSTSFYLVIKGSVSIKTLDPQKIKEELGKKNENYKSHKNLDKIIEKNKIEKFFDDHEKDHVSQGVSEEFLVSESISSNDSLGLNIYNYENKHTKTTEESGDNKNEKEKEMKEEQKEEQKEDQKEEKKEGQKEEQKEEQKEDAKEEKEEEKKEGKKEGKKEDQKEKTKEEKIEEKKEEIREEKKEDNSDSDNDNKKKDNDDIYSEINSNKDESKNIGDKAHKSMDNNNKGRNKNKKEDDNEDQIDMNIYNSFSSEEQIKKNKSRILKKDTLLDRIQRIKENRIKRRGGNIYQAKNVTSKLLNQDILKLQKNLGCQIKVFSQGSFFGEWDLIYDRPRQNFAYAEEDTDLLVLDKQYFDKYFLKHISKADIERKYFITRSIPLLKIENLPNLHLEFFDKDTIVYTNFDKATEFFIIFQGQGALKKLKLKNIKNKNDIYKHKNSLETIWFVDKGCIVGLETGRKNISNYDNIFMITEDNTALYRISLNDAINSNYNYKLKNNLKTFLYDLYCKQNNIFKQIDEKKNIKSSVGYIKKEKEEDDVEKNQELINTIYKEEINYNVEHNTHHYHHFMLDTQSFGSFESLKNFKNKTGINLKEKFPKIRNHLFKEIFNTMPNKNNKEGQNSRNIEFNRNKNKIDIDSNFTYTLPNKKYNSFKNKLKFKNITSDEFMTIIKDTNVNKAKSCNRIKKMKNTNNLFLNYAKNSNYLKKYNKSKKNKLLLKKNKSTKVYNSFKKSSIGNLNVTSTGFNSGNKNNTNNTNNKNIMTLTSSLSILKDDNKYNENILFRSQMNWRKSLTNKKFVEKTSSLTNLQRNVLGKNMQDKYLYIMLNIPKRNNYYNSGNFNVPLVGSKNT